ncbi:MAG: hypothetical protein KC733_12450, partial [Candidatus Omnitrophica bacterium]|nr:hypothetical protein [Candidatus Omnitrophota bacterium]
ASIIGNTLIDNGAYGIRLNSSSADGVTIKNNMIDNTNSEAIETVAGSTVTSSQYNNYYNAGGTNISHLGTGTVPGTGDTQVAGGFINRAGDDYQLAPGGNGWEDGTCLASPYNADILGRVRAVQGCDQGAYESSKRRVF